MSRQKRGTECGHSTITMPSKYGGKWETKCLNTRFSSLVQFSLNSGIQRDAKNVYVIVAAVVA